jgi:DNA-binding MarR family transcriptional regulator
MALEQSTFLVTRRLASQCELSLTCSDVLHRLDTQGASRPTALASALWLKQPSLVPLIKRLEQHGIVRRSIDPADRRVAVISITDVGREVVGQHRRRLSELLDQLLVVLDADERQVLYRAANVTLPLITRLNDLDPPEPAVAIAARARGRSLR